MRPRRLASITVAIAAATLTLSGCMPAFLAQPQQPPQQDTPQTPPQPAETQPAETQPTATEPTVISSGSYGPITVDDGAGDTWTYTVDAIVTDVPTTTAPPAGMQAVGIVISATHDDGSTSFTPTCFDITLISDAGDFVYADSTLTATQNDIAGLREDFTSAVAVLAVPEGTELTHWQITSRYGDDVQDIVYG